MNRLLLVCLLAALAGCTNTEPSSSKVRAIIGAVLIDGNGGPPITDSVVVVSGSRIRAAGLRANVAIPAEADKINGSGKFIVPGLIDLFAGDRLDSGVTTARVLTSAREFGGDIGDPEAARRKVADLGAKRADFLFIRADDARLKPQVSDAILEEARKYNIPVTASVTTLAQTRELLKFGAAGFVRMIGDTEELDQGLLAKLRALQIIFAPALTLVRAEERGRVMRNTKSMAAAGVLIGVGSGGGADATIHELELLVEAGLSPLEVTAAATRNGALALRKLDELGTIEAKKRADLVVLNGNPLEDVRNFRKIDRVMAGGEWVDRADGK